MSGESHCAWAQSNARESGSYTRALRFEHLEPRFLLSTFEYSFWDQRVVDVASGSSRVLTAVITGNPSSVQFDPDFGADIPLTQTSANTWQATIDAPTLLYGYQQSTGHNSIGFLEVSDPATPDWRKRVSINVYDQTMPDIDVTTLSSMVQFGPHVVNMRWDALWTTDPAPPEVFQSFYDVFTDEYDFLSIIAQVETSNERFYTAVRNDTLGIGSVIDNNGTPYGSADRLQGFVNYPIETFFDLAETGSLHEIGHRWAVRLNHPSLDLSGPGAHWPISDFALGIMGYGSLTGVGQTLRFDFVDQGDGTYLVVSAPKELEFNQLELYLMGLVPPAVVPSGRVFINQDQHDQLHAGGILQGPVDTVTIDEIIAVYGQRNPAAGEAQTEFRMATIVLSDGRLLTHEEMAFFDYMAARGEARTELPYVSGGASDITKPFYLATQGLGTLRTTIEMAPGDSNGDGTTNAADYVYWRKMGFNGEAGYSTWRTNFGRIPAGASDYNGDGATNAADYVYWRKTGLNGEAGYNMWRSNFGRTGAGALAGERPSQILETESLGVTASGDFEKFEVAPARSEAGSVLLGDTVASLQQRVGFARTEGARRSYEMNEVDGRHDAALLAWLSQACDRRVLTDEPNTNVDSPETTFQSIDVAFAAIENDFPRVNQVSDGARPLVALR